MVVVAQATFGQEKSKAKQSKAKNNNNSGKKRKSNYFADEDGSQDRWLHLDNDLGAN